MLQTLSLSPMVSIFTLSALTLKESIGLTPTQAALQELLESDDQATHPASGQGPDFAPLELIELNNHLRHREFLTGPHSLGGKLSLADVILYGVLHPYKLLLGQRLDWLLQVWLL